MDNTNVGHPFTTEEKEIMDLLVEAHNKYCKLKPLNFFDGTEWVTAFHSLQNILIVRTAVRNYPKYFKS